MLPALPAARQFIGCKKDCPAEGTSFARPVARPGSSKSQLETHLVIPLERGRLGLRVHGQPLVSGWYFLQAPRAPRLPGSQAPRLPGLPGLPGSQGSQGFPTVAISSFLLCSSRRASSDRRASSSRWCASCCAAMADPLAQRHGGACTVWATGRLGTWGASGG